MLKHQVLEALDGALTLCGKTWLQQI